MYKYKISNLGVEKLVNIGGICSFEKQAIIKSAFN